MSATRVQKLRAERTVSLLKSCLAPRDFFTAPPNLYTLSEFIKRFDFVGDFQIGPDNALVDVQVPTQTGLVLWLPNRGLDSIQRMGIVPTNASVQVTLTGTIPVAAISASAYNFITPYVQASGVNQDQGLTTLTFNAPLAVPVGSSGDGVTFSPSIYSSFNSVPNFSRARVVSGDVQLISDSVPVGATSLTGYFAVGAVNDTRDVGQILVSGTNTYAAFDPNTMDQASVTRKEGIKNAGCGDGVISLVGSDIDPLYTSAYGTRDVMDAEWINWYPTSYSAYPTSMPTAIGNIFGVVLGCYWISPWQTTMSTVLTPSLPLANYVAGPIDEYGVLDFEVRFSFQGWDSGSGSLGNFGHLRVTFYHYFATCNASGINVGALNWRVEQDDQSVKTYVQNLNSSYTVRNYVVNSCPRMYGTAGAGKYIGTVVQISFNEDYVFASNPTGLVGFVQGQGNPYGPGPVIGIRQRSINVRGQTGPARIFRWDGVGSGQFVKLNGCVQAQCVPAGTIVPYVQDAMGKGEVGLDLTVMCWLAYVFNADTPIKRNWVLKQYLKYKEEIIKRLSPAQLLEWAPSNESMHGLGETLGLYDAIHDEDKALEAAVNAAGKYKAAKRGRLTFDESD